MSSRIILENNEGRIGMGFDASEVGRDPDAEHLLRSSYSPSMQYDVRKHQKMLRSFVGLNQMFRRIRSTDSIQASILSSLTRSPTEMIRDTFRFSHVVPESMRCSLPGLSGNLRGLSNYPRMPSDVLKQARMLGHLGLSGSIAQAFESRGLDSANIAAWSLRRVLSFRPSAPQPTLKAATTLGPIVVSPDYEDDAPFDYHPNLERLLPKTATESGDAVDVEEMWDVVVAYAQGMAVHHRTAALLSVMGSGRQFVIRVCKHPAAVGTAAGTVAGAISGAAGGVVFGDIVAEAVSDSVNGGVGALIMYFLTRR